MNSSRITLFFSIPFLSLLLIISGGCASGKQNKITDDQVFRKGETYQHVKCFQDSAIQYALYLPSAYLPEKVWPVVICFDPHAEGLLPVNLFREQAEKYGFIIAGSNNSKNGMDITETTSIYRKLLDDLSGRFSIDTGSIYVAGFSGGSRVASAAAFTEGNIAGVIACGAGLPGMNKEPVKPFSYLAVAGLLDFNYPELMRTDESFASAGYVHHLLTFEGIHEWPLKEVIPDIFTWIMFDRMRNKDIPADRDMINRFIDENYSKSQAAGGSGNLLKQRDCLLMMLDYLQGLTDTSPLESEIQKLGNDSEVKQQIEAMQAIFDHERQLQSFYSNKLQNDGIEYWKAESGKLREQAGRKPSTDESRMYQRVLGYLSLNAYMLSNSAIKQNDLNSASRFIELYKLVDPTNAEHRYMAATVAMKQGKKDQAITEITEAYKLGFKDNTRLLNDTVFTKLHEDPAFKKLPGIK